MDKVVAQKVSDFFSHYPQRTYPKDQIIIFSGEAPEKVFYLVSGRISQYDISYRGDEVVVNVFKPGAFFPMSWAINRTPNSYFYKAEEPAVVHVAPPDEVVTFLKSEPDVLFDLLSRVYRGTDGLLERTVRLMSGSARSRVMYELLNEARRFGKAEVDGSTVLSVHESDIAASSGLARETVSREIHRLKELNLVAIDAKGIRLLDIAQLETLLASSS